MQVAVVFAALFAVASAGVLSGPTLLSSPVAYASPIGIAHAPVLRTSSVLINQAPVLRASPVLINQAPLAVSHSVIGHPALARTVIAGPGLVAHHAPIGLVQPTIIG